MHCQCSKSDLLPAINLVERAVTSQETLAVLNGIFLETEGTQRLLLRSTNLELGIQTQIEIQVVETGNCNVNGRLLASIVRRLPDEPIIFSEKDGKLEITAGTVELSLPLYNKEDFPILPQVPEEHIKLPVQTLDTLIRNTIFSVSRDETKPALMGILFEFNEDSVNAVATDSSRLAFIQEDLADAFSQNHKAIVPTSSVTEIFRSLPTKGEAVIGISDDQLIVAYDDTIFSSRLINAEFPQYRLLFPKEQPISINVRRQTLLASVERAALLQTEDNQPIILDVQDGVLELSTPPSSIGHFREQITVEHAGENGKAAYSARFLQDMLKASKEESLTFQFNGDFRPAVFKKQESDKHLYIIMPIRLHY